MYLISKTSNCYLKQTENKKIDFWKISSYPDFLRPLYTLKHVRHRLLYQSQFASTLPISQFLVWCQISLSLLNIGSSSSFNITVNRWYVNYKVRNINKKWVKRLVNPEKNRFSNSTFINPLATVWLSPTHRFDLSQAPWRHIQGIYTSGADCTPKNNEKKSYKYMSYLSSFMRYNELSVLITFTKDARNDHLAFEDKPARVLSFIWLLYHSWCFSNLSEALLYSIS